MKRPFASDPIEKLEATYVQASREGDTKTLRALAHEVTFRSTARARDLRAHIETALAGNRGAATERNGGQSRSERSAPGASPIEKGSNGNSTQKRSKSKRAPTPEQAEAISAFRKGGSLKINAYAGAGKTSTLEMLAHSTSRRGQYLAFNRDIVGDARKRFPDTVNCSTTHGLAYRSMAGKYGGSSEKLTGKVNANQLAEMLGLKQWRIDKEHSLRPRSQGFLILDTIRRFAMSADLEPGPSHVPRHGALIAASEETMNAVTDYAVHGANHVWARMQDPDDKLPLGHDGYLKLWALSNPVIAADFILMDEAQDTNPVVLETLRRQPAQMVYVGDKYQQIYEWRGAVNAMEAIETDAECYLTTSFRFGSGIAEPASKLLGLLGEERALRGNPALTSRIASTPHAGTILSRTNASTVTALIEALDQGKRPHLIGGTDELVKMLRGVSGLKRGEPTEVPDFFGFANWQEVVEFARSGEGEHLQTFVNLVEGRGEKQLLWALGKVVEADAANVVISTAHKAKGREWPTVRLMDDFVKTQPKRGRDAEPATGSPTYDPSELRLLYVALTRAKESIEVPEPLLKLIGIAAERSASTPPIFEARAGIAAKSRATSSSKPIRVQQPLRQAPSWTPPKDWSPVPARNSEALEPQPSRAATAQPKKRKGFFGWLFG